jgi:signal transduction histidine kinase/pSer/pThr/pTyr-binding forkhead associated (FHA) protein/ActR/RegA family two-component response regulator
MVKLFILNGPNQGRSFDLQSGVSHIGRSPDNDIQIQDYSISRKHLEILRRDDKFLIEDLKSANGTLLNGERINPGAKFDVKEGHPIKIGKTIICLGEDFSVDDKFAFDYESLTATMNEESMAPSNPMRTMTYPKTMELFHNVSNVLMGSLNLYEILDKIMDYLLDLLKRIDRGAILIRDDKTGKLKQVITRSRYKDSKGTLNYSRTIADGVLKEGKPVMMADTSHENRNAFSDSMKQIRSVMCVPLISKDETRGVIYVDSLNKPHGFRNEDLSLLSSLGTPVAMAIENALLYSNLESIVKHRTRVLRETQKKLRESQARFKAIFANMSSGVVVYSVINDGEDFVVIDLNRAARKIEKIKKKDALGKSVYEIFPNIEEIGLLDVFKRVWETGKPEQYSMTLHREERISAWREYYVYCLPSGEIVAICDDVTDKKIAEEEQKALQKQLLFSQKMESIGALAGGTAHNFRNILQGILGNIEYLGMIYGERPEIKEVSKNIHDSIEKGIELINNLLHFARVGDEYELVDLDLADVIMKTYVVIEKVFDKNIEIKLNLDKNLFVKGKDSLLSQVFLNLFTNARDAMPNGGKLLIEAKKVKKNVIATVSDTGYGMDKKTMEKIFDPFFTLKDVGKGTGLGLSTSHGIIEQHKGSITVSSKPGRGTTFKVSIPWVKPESFRKPQPTEEIIFGKGQKVLIVDDESPSLNALTELVERLGYQVTAVENPMEALKNYNKWDPDVVLMDRSMPEMDGITCIKKMVKNHPDANIIIVSGYDESESNGIDESVKGLIKGYLTKPCGLEELSHELYRVLEA